jgi:hypothetical protein
MSSARQIIYLLFIVAILAGIGLSISKLMAENSQYIASEEVFTVPNVTPGEIKIIDWETTEKLLSTCQIKVIFQKRNLEVTLRDQNDQIYQVTEQKLNDISQLAKKYQGPCDIIQTITE